MKIHKLAQCFFGVYLVLTYILLSPAFTVTTGCFFLFGCFTDETEHANLKMFVKRLTKKDLIKSTPKSVFRWGIFSIFAQFVMSWWSVSFMSGIFTMLVFSIGFIFGIVSQKGNIRRIGRVR